jgi:hypothetical protein
VATVVPIQMKAMRLVSRGASPQQATAGAAGGWPPTHAIAAGMQGTMSRGSSTAEESCCCLLGETACKPGTLLSAFDCRSALPAKDCLLPLAGCNKPPPHTHSRGTPAAATGGQLALCC